MKTVAVLFAAALATVLTGCSDPKAANKENFEKSINAYLETSPACLYPMMPREFPAKVELSAGKSELDQKNNASHTAELDRFVKVGLLTVKDGQVEKPNMFAFGNQPKTLTIPVKTYELTEEGKKAFHSEKAMMGKVSGFCYGKRKVETVENFTEPGEFMGMTISHVKFKYTVQDKAKWVDDAALRERFPKDLPGEARPAQATLIKTSEGWVHENLYSK